MFELNYPRFEEKKENLFCSAECGLDYPHKSRRIILTHAAMAVSKYSSL